MSDNRAKHYRSLCRTAAKLLNCKPTDEQALHYGLLMLAREGFADRIINGSDIDPGALMRLDESLKAYMPAVKPIGVTVRIVDNIAGTCPKCGYSGCEPRPQEPSHAPTIDGEAVKANAPPSQLEPLMDMLPASSEMKRRRDLDGSALIRSGI
jgi:hypothetical protein